jgi:4-hydroxy-tetrahydrodipicolinate synthase
MFAGSLVALVTPMRADGSVDFGCLQRLVEFHVSAGTDAIVSVGTTGESATLDFDEHIDVIRRTVEYSGGRIPVIGGTGGNATSEAIELTRAARAAGADACLLVTPYYNKPPQEGLYRHFAAVAKAVDVPQILYNVPGRTGCDMLPETVERLSRLDNVVGLKEAKGELPRIRELIERCGEDFSIYSGDDATAMESILLGCKGDISVTANVAPALMHDMCAAALDGDRPAAQVLDARLRGLHDKLFVEPNPIPVKWALQQMGLIPEGIRLPLVPLDPRYHDEVRQAMIEAGVLS